MRALSSRTTLCVGAAAVSLVVACSDIFEPKRTSEIATAFNFNLDPENLIGTLGGSYSTPVGLNELDVMVGVSVNSENIPYVFTWTMSEGIISPFPDSAHATGYAINDYGTVVGNRRLSGHTRAFRAGPNGWEDLLGFSGHSGTEAYSISNNNVAVGVGVDSAISQNAYVPVMWTSSGQIVGLNGPGQLYTGGAYDINDQGIVVGIVDFRPFRWSASEGIVLLPSPGFNNLGGAMAVNNLGGIVGGINTTTGQSHAALWKSDGTLVDLGTLGGATSTASDINDHYQVVGHSDDEFGGQQGFVWDSVNGMQPLGQFFPRAINNNGLIAGQVSTPNGYWQAAYRFLDADTSLSVSLSCDGGTGSSVVRGSTISCTASWTPASIPASEITFEWSFQGDSIRVFPASDAVAFDPPSPIDTTGVGLDLWEGIAVLGGQVFVRASRLSVTDSSLAHFEVMPRTGAMWGNLPVTLAPGYLDIPTDSTQTLANQPGPDIDSDTGIMGLNIDSVVGVYGSDPMVRGVPHAPTVPFGPNRGLGYVEHLGDVRATRAVAVRTWLSGNEQAKFDYNRVPNELLTNRALMQAMRQNANGNKSKHGQDSTAFLEGVLAHEMYGDGGKGHQGQIELAGTSLATCGMAPAILEGVVGPGAGDVLIIVGIVLEEARRSLLAATDHDHVHGNFGSVRAYEVVSQVTSVTHTYSHVIYGGDVPKSPEFDSEPDPRYKCTRTY